MIDHLHFQVNFQHVIKKYTNCVKKENSPWSWAL